MNTSPEADLGAVFLLTPLWWALGVNFFIYHLVALSVFARLLLGSARSQNPLKMPLRIYPFIFFLFFYAVSLLVNAGLRPAPRIFASLNNYSMLLMGGMIMLAVYNSRITSLLTWAIRNGRTLCFVTGILGVVSLMLWFLGYPNLSVEPLMIRLVPSLADYPYFNSLMIMKLTMTEWLFGNTPRLSLYSGAPTATGGLLMMIMPMLLLYYGLRRGKVFECSVIFVLALFALLFSQSRSAFVGGFAALIFVNLMARKNKILVGLVTLVAAVLFFNWVYQGIEWLFNARQSSNVGRFILYQDALDIVWGENFLLGMGVKMRDDFTMTSIGSHGNYIELLFVGGVIGLALFIIFQFTIALDWFQQQKFLKNNIEIQIWKSLGLAYWATNLWLMTDTIQAYPYIAYGYFMMTGILLAFGKSIREGQTFEWRQGRLELISEQHECSPALAIPAH